METARPRAVGRRCEGAPAPASSSEKPIHHYRRTYSQPIWRPLFCCSSQLINGFKYSIIARVEMSSPGFNTTFCDLVTLLLPSIQISNRQLVELSLSS